MKNEDTEEEKRPPIAEKVKFWLEQDRINKELIPRVIKVHKTVTNHIEGHEEVSAVISSLEARFTQKIHRVRMQAMVVATVSLVVAVASIVLSVVSL